MKSVSTMTFKSIISYTFPESGSLSTVGAYRHFSHGKPFSNRHEVCSFSLIKRCPSSWQREKPWQQRPVDEVSVLLDVGSVTPLWCISAFNNWIFIRVVNGYHLILKIMLNGAHIIKTNITLLYCSSCPQTSKLF